MEALLSRKAKDEELGLAKKRLEETISYWGVNWNARTLTELPEYVQDLYILFTYTLWLEEQVAALRETKNDDFRRDTQESSVVNQTDALESATSNNDKRGDTVGTVLSEPYVPPPSPETPDGTTGTELRPDDPNIHTRKELGI